MNARTLAVFSTLTLAGSASVASAQFAITTFTIDAGGGTSSSATFTLSGTIGQPDAGTPMTSSAPGGIAITGGFWPATNPTPPPSCPQDFNQDGNLDPDDLGDMINCFFMSPPCAQADFNHDGDINPDDLGDFINLYFGPPC